MSLSGLSLIISACFFHAYWNFLMKKANGKIVFLWLIAVYGCIFFSPVIAWLFITHKVAFTAATLLSINVSALLTLSFYFALQKGFKEGDLSTIFPISRGSGAFFALILAVLFLHEKLTWHVGIGALLSICGVFLANSKTATDTHHPHALKGLMYGLLAGVLLAALTLWLKYSVNRYKIDPIFLALASNSLPALYLLPFALRKNNVISNIMRIKRREVFGVSLFNNLSYILLLLALQITPVVYFAPAREISILFGLALGVIYLQEKITWWKIIGTGSILSGIILLSLG